MLYLIGAPGSGKSTTMEQVVLQLGLDWQPDERVWRELWVNPLTNVLGDQVAVSLGKRRPGFAGTDALSMSASPRVLEWMHETDLPEMVLGEGARLGTPRFLVQADFHADVTLVQLTAGTSTLNRRCAEKGLSDTYRKGRATASDSCYTAVSSLGIRSLRLETGNEPPAAIAERVLQFWNGYR